MKKIFSMLVLASVIGLTSCQQSQCNSTSADTNETISLKEAFDQLSKVQNINVTAPDYNLPVVSDVVTYGTIAAAYNLDSAQTLATGKEVYKILSRVPMSYMINGGNNGQVAAFVYVTPDDADNSDILIATMSGYKGAFSFIYGSVSRAEAQAIQSAPMSMEGSSLIIESVMPDGNDFNIILNKGR